MKNASCQTHKEATVKHDIPGDGCAYSLQKLNEIAFVLLSIRPIILCNPPLL